MIAGSSRRALGKMWGLLSSLPVAVVQHNVMSMLSLKDWGMLDTAVLERSKREAVKEWLQATRMRGSFELTSTRSTPEMIDWIRDNQVTVSKLILGVAMYYDDSTYDTIAWLIAMSDETAIHRLFGTEEQLTTLFSVEEVTSKILSTCNNYGSSFSPGLAVLIASKCINLKHLTFTLESEEEHTLATCSHFYGWSQLRSLRIEEGFGFGPASSTLFSAVPKCVNLVRLESMFMVDDFMIPIAQSCVLLEEILLPDVELEEFTNASLLAIAQNCLSLRVLDVSSFLVHDSAVAEVCQRCPQLTTFYMHPGSAVTISSAYVMLTHGRYLQNLKVPLSMFALGPQHAIDSEQATAELKGYPTMPALKTFLLTGDEDTDLSTSFGAASTLIRFAARADELQFESGRNLTVEVLAAISHCYVPLAVTNLICRDVRCVTDSHLLSALPRLAQLQKLALDRADMLTDAALNAIAQHCPRLQEVSLAGAPLTTDAGWLALLQCCGALTSVNAFRANLTDSFLREVPRYGARITHLNISGCLLLTPEAIVRLAESCVNLLQLTARAREMTEVDIDRIVALERTRRFRFLRNNYPHFRS
jgi:hypothetical protein